MARTDMFAKSSKQQLELRPVGWSNRLRCAWRWVFGALRPGNPFRTSTGVPVTGQVEGALQPTPAPVGVLRGSTPAPAAHSSEENSPLSY